MDGLPLPGRQKAADEGGCGVVGLAASIPVVGRHLVVPARQLHNRGNGKGGGLDNSGQEGDDQSETNVHAESRPGHGTPPGLSLIHI